MEEKKVPALRFRGFDNAWEHCKLGDVFEQTSNLVTLGNGEVKLWSLTVEDGLTPKTERYNREFLVKKDDKFKEVRPGDIVYNPMNMTLGAVGYNGMTRSVAVSGYYTTMIARENYDAYYINTWLKSSQAIKLYKIYATGSLIEKQRVQFPTLSIISASFPRDEEQKQIGEYFRNLDHLISLHQRKLEMLKKIKKSMLEKMFPKNDAKVPELRFSDFTDAWEQHKLGEVVKEVTRNDSASEAPIMMITANHGFIEQSERYAFNNAGESLKRYILLEKGELAYNHGASKLRPYGSCFALTTAENARIPFVYHCFSAEEQNAEFISIELNGSDVENQLRKIVSSGARMDGLLNISFAEYTSVSVLLPKIEEQNRIADFFRNLDHLISLHQRKLEKLKNIKKSMLEKMFII